MNIIVSLWVQQILLGKRKYTEVPRQLKSQVAELLIEKNRMDLIINE